MKKLTKEKETDMWNILLVNIIAAITPKVVSSVVSFIENTIEEASRIEIFEEISQLFSDEKDESKSLAEQQKKSIKKRKVADRTKFTKNEYDYIVEAYHWFYLANNDFITTRNKYKQPDLIRTLNTILGYNKTASAYRAVWDINGGTYRINCRDDYSLFDDTKKTFYEVLTNEGS